MPATNPRIVVVDDNNGLFTIVRAAMELLGRRPRLIEVHTGDDAITEVRLGAPDLMITSQTLPGKTNGPVLALMAKRELAALPIMVLGNENDPEMDEETLSQSPFQYMRKPLAPEAFLRAMRVALDGPEAVQTETSTQEMLIPVPQIDINKLQPLLFKAMREVGAMAVVLADRNGKVLAYDGAAGYIDRDLLAAALGAGFTGTTRMLEVIGNEPRVLKYYDGDKSDLFALSVGLHHFMILIYDGNAPGAALGNVRRYGTEIANEMLKVIGMEVAYSMGKPALPAQAAPVIEAPTKPVDIHKEGRKTRRTQEVQAVKPEVPAKTSTKPSPAVPAPAEKAAPLLEPITNFDPSLLDMLGSVDLSAAEDMFSHDKLSSLSSAGSSSRISFDDAMAQGIIANVDE